MSAATRVTAVGEILVELMSTDPGTGFREPQTLRGPYPSGAPAIFADQVARLGVPTAMVGAVGDDDFGRLNIERLERDGVDVTAIGVSAELPTGIAFVRYRPNGDRDFLFTIGSSAAARIDVGGVEQHLARTDHLHVVGSSLTMASVADYVAAAVPIVKGRGGTVSFDPNVRREIMQDPAMRGRLDGVLRQSDLVLPSEGELAHLCEADTDEAAVDELLGRGISEIVLKRGARGASRFTRDGAIHHPGFAVQEIDPTGAGDCFGATYVGCRRLGHTPEHALESACAAGALAVGQRGPMEGNSSLEAIGAFLDSHRPETVR